MAADTVLIFRSELLPPSETFIVEQSRTLQTFRPVFAGLKRLKHGVPLLDAALVTMSRRENALRDRLCRKLFVETRYGPRFLHRLVQESAAPIHNHLGVDACIAVAVRHRFELPRFRHRLVQESAALIHTHFAVDACIALPVSQRLDVPLLVTLHGYDVTRND